METGDNFPNVLAVKRLSPKLRTVLKHVHEGMDNDQIAAAMSISLSTGKVYVSSLYQKLNIPRVPSKNDRRKLLVKAYDDFTKLYSIDESGMLEPQMVVGNGEVSEARPAEAPAAISTPPKVNGHAAPEAPVQKPAPAPRVQPLAQGYGVGITIIVPEPETVEDAATVVLGAEGAAEKLSALLTSGYYPEIINDYQSLSGTRSVTKLILIKRKR